MTGVRSSKTNDRISAAPSFFSSKKWIKLIPKTTGNRKRDCAWGCAWGIDTTWENLQIEKHKSGRRSFRSPNWFVLFDQQIFSGGVYPPSATSHTISFSISNSFWYYIVGWLNSRGVSYSGGTALWSWWSSLFQKAEVVRRCCTWSWTCLAALDDFDVVCVQKWTKLSHGALVQLLSLILGLSSAWWRIGSRRNIRLCCLSMQSSSLPPTLDALSMHVRRANYQAVIWRRALHPGSSLPGPHGYGWLCKPESGDDPASHSSVEIQWMTRPAAPQALLDLVECGCTSGCSTQRCRCR